MARHDIELIATLIGGNAGDATSIATSLLSRFGGLRQLLHADTIELRSQSGVGEIRAARLRAVPELARRYLEATLPAGETIRSPADTETYLLARLRHLGHELFCCLFLDNRHRVLRFDQMFRGTIDGSSG